jgi:hypothetical protein
MNKWIAECDLCGWSLVIEPLPPEGIEADKEELLFCSAFWEAEMEHQLGTADLLDPQNECLGVPRVRPLEE